MESRGADVPANGLDLDTATDRRTDLFRVGDEVVRDLLLRSELSGLQVGELQSREAVVPGRPIGNQGVPPL
jgi:hypothetical protein